jgi:hypothetical protein
MFELADGRSAPFSAWCHDLAALGSRSGPVRFFAESSALQQLEVEYRLVDEGIACREHCQIAHSVLRQLVPGHYLLIGPRRDGSRVDVRGLVHSGDVSAPLAGEARDFDYLSMRIQAVA